MLYSSELKQKGKKQNESIYFTFRRGLIVNLMCRLDWTMKCPDICSNIILGIPVCVWRTFTFKSVD